MHHLCSKLCSIITVLFPVLACADVLFEDNFENREHSSRKWTFLSSSSSTLQFIDGIATIKNSSDTYSALAVHRSKEIITTFTLSAKVSSDYPGSGLFFCLHEKNGGYAGYGALLSDGEVSVYKYYPESADKILESENAFVKSNGNMLTVSKKDQQINIFCNGYFIFSVVDSEFVSGDIAMIVPPESEASFDSVVFEDKSADTLYFAEFTDEFAEENGFGWNVYGNASEKWESSHLQISTTAFQQYYTGVEIPLNLFCMKTRVRFVSGDTSSRYGFFIKMANDTGNSHVYCQFAISGNKQYVVNGEPSAEQFTNGTSDDIKGFCVDDCYDALMLSRDDNAFTFYVNDMELVKTVGINGKIIGAGLFVSKGLSISFDNFQISVPQMPVAAGKIKKRSVQVNSLRKFSTAVDLLGRYYLKRDNIAANIILKYEKAGNCKSELKIK